MNVKVPLAALLLLALALGYVLGTEDGRARRDAMLARLRHEEAEVSEAAAEEAPADDDSA
jgi:hypothetical protein